MLSLVSTKAALIQKAGRPLAILSKNSPQIMLGAGVVGVVVATVLACKATLKVEDILVGATEQLDLVKEVRSDPKHEDDYTEEDAQKDTAIIYVQTAVKFLKLYLPAITVGVLSLALIMQSHRILQKRNIALMAAYKVISESFKAYRERVIDELGEDKDRQFKWGITKEKIDAEFVDEDGKTKKRKEVIENFHYDGYSTYARWFDEFSIRWHKNPEYNLIFLKTQQNFANDLLNARGHIFLNEVYDMLGIKRTVEGTIVGWVRDNKNPGIQSDGYVTFNIYNPHDSDSRAFINGLEAANAILLDFNVDGVVYDQI